MPQDFISAESAILGSVLLGNDLWPQAGVLAESAFGLDAHRMIFRAMRDLVDSGRPIDEVLLAEELNRRGELERIGGAAYLTSLTDGVVIRRDIDPLVEIVLENATRRSASKAGEQLQHLAADGAVSVTALAQTAERLVGQCREPSDALPPRHSEEALALRFSGQYADDLRYVANWNRWLSWDGMRWSEDDTLSVFDRVRAICRRASSECADHERATALKLASSTTVSAVERLAKADRRHAAQVGQWDSHPWLLNTRAGTIDLRTGGITANQREDYLTKLTAAGPGGDWPLWLRFIARITGYSRELQSFLQRATGYCLTGVTQEHAMFFLYGTGANGKSVFLSTLSGLLGDFARTAPTSVFTASNTEQHPTEVASLRGARMVTAIETEDGTRWAESKIKAFTGGDKIVARFMRCDFFEFVPEFKLLVAGNHKPGLRSVDEAMRRRLHLIPFTVTIPKSEQDPALAEKLKGEYPGILQWAIEGCLEWQRQGLNPPEVVRDATDQYLAAEDAIGRWLEERCVIDRLQWTAGSLLYRDFSSWCEATGELRGTQKRFTQALESRGFSPQRTREARGFAGIALRSGLSVTDVTGAPISDVTRAGVRPTLGAVSHVSLRQPLNWAAGSKASQPERCEIGVSEFEV